MITIGRNTQLLAAQVDDEDEESVKQFRLAVSAIDEYRSVRTAKGEDEQPETREAPLAPVDPSGPFTPDEPAPQ